MSAPVRVSAVSFGEQPLLALNTEEAGIVRCLVERLFPADESSPGAGEIGVLTYIDRALSGVYQVHLEQYRLGLAGLNSAAYAVAGSPFEKCSQQGQDGLLAALEAGTLPKMEQQFQKDFFELIRAHTQEGLFADPLYGGNRNKAGWRVLRHPGVWLENSAEENLSPEPVTKGGVILSLADVDLRQAFPGGPPTELANYDPQRGAAKPEGEADVVLVGVGAMGGLAAPLLARAGLKVVGLEAGPWRTRCDFVPDELGETFYCRANMSQKFLTETPRWRRGPKESGTVPALFSFGRMMNSVGGSVIHYGAWLRRFHPFHFQALTRVRERWGPRVLPQDCSLVDWPMTYAELEPYYAVVEKIAGVAGDETNPFTPRSSPYPMPPLRPFRMGEKFRDAAKSMGLHPYPVPVGINSVPYDDRPATTYTAWSNGFGSFNDSKWHPGLSSVPEALATGNFDLRTNSRAIRILTDLRGHVEGVEYVDALGRMQVQKARIVILSSFVFENIRLMLLSGDEKHKNGLGNDSLQVGKHYMTKQFSRVLGEFPDIYFNRHTGPNAQAMIVDDFVSADFDSVQHGFLGGSTVGVENQYLPIQISREALPPDVQRWGKPYKDQIRKWQHFAVVAVQSDALPYHTHTVDLDPQYRDRSGWGLPVVRITYDLRENETKIAEWMAGKSEEVLRVMGATKTWRGPMLTGVCSSHDLGGCRMGDDPAISVVNADLAVHDTPGLYVFSGAAFPSCPGVNPNLTIWALVYRAAERLVAHARKN